MSAAKAEKLNLDPFQGSITGTVPRYSDTQERNDSTLEEGFIGARLSNEYPIPDASDPLSLEEDFGSNPQQDLSIPPKRKRNPLPYLPKTVVRSRFIALQKWEGLVIEVSQDGFIARLIDMDRNQADLEAEFALDEVHHEDKKLIQPGAVFYWTIGYKEDRGQRIRASIIRFRRLPAWQKHELEAAERDAKGFADLFGWK